MGELLQHGIITCLLLSQIFTRTTSTTEKMCKEVEADLVFILDSSGSINKTHSASGRFENWHLSLKFITSIVDRIDAGKAWKVGMVVFSDTAINKFYLNTYNEKSRIKGALLSTKYMDGHTNTSGGLKTARLEQFRMDRGDRSTAPNLIVIITDGESTVDGKSTIAEAEKLHAMGVKVFSVGVTTNIIKEELQGLSSPPRKEGVNWFRSVDFDDLSTFVQAITEKACQYVKAVTRTCDENDPAQDKLLEEYQFLVLILCILLAIFFFGCLTLAILLCTIKCKECSNV